MAIVTLTDSKRVLRDTDEVSRFLEGHGIWYRKFDNLASISAEASDDEILAAFDAPLREQMQSGGYTTADVVSLRPDLPGLDAMLARFSAEHWHSEDEVRFIVEGGGVFHIHPSGGEVFSIEVEQGDMINVPEGTHHWFDLCADKQIRCIRLFQDPSGWTPHYTESGEEARHEPVCMGPRFIPPAPTGT